MVRHGSYCPQRQHVESSFCLNKNRVMEAYYVLNRHHVMKTYPVLNKYHVMTYGEVDV